MFKFAAIVLALLLSACASMTMDGFVGKPLESAMAQYGSPANVFDLPDGRRAFQWQINSSFVVPGQVTTNYYAPAGSFATATTTYTPAQQINQACLYTMYASERGGRWVFVGYEKPRVMCQ